MSLSKIEKAQYELSLIRIGDVFSAKDRANLEIVSAALDNALDLAED